MSSRSFCWLAVIVAGLVAFAVLITGCSAKRYRKGADAETYRIIQQVEQKVFGHTNAFTIETLYSAREPDTIWPSDLIGERNGSNTLVINLEKALDLAVKNSREYQSQKEQLYLSALSLTGARWAFTPQFFANSTLENVGTSGGGDSTSLGTQFGVSQLLKTGGRLGLTLGNDLLRYFSGNGINGRDSTINTLSVNLSQPLLRGLGINSPEVENLTQAERNVVYAVRSYSLYQQQFAVNTVNAYFDLVTQKKQVRNFYQNYTNRVETTRYLDARAVDRERQSSVDDARNAELGARSTYINSLASYLTALDSFKLRLGLPISTRVYLDDNDLEELIQFGISHVDVDREAAFKICTDKQMEVLNAIDRFEDGKRKVRVAADQLKPGVTVFGGAAIGSGSGGFVSPLDYTKFDINRINYNAGLSLDLPLARLNERNSYRATLISFESQLRALSLTLDNYKDQLDRGLRSLEQNRLNYTIRKESLKVAERRLENNGMLLEAGRATIRDVREAQDSLISAQNDLAATYADYLRARLQLLLNIGVINIKPEKFWLHDPLEEMLTPEQRSIPTLRMPDNEAVPPEKFLDPVL